ncbi:hypothetical protein CPB85DRAFT_1430319 [Mucidula mucida]|nr:hypothetical protein CPB85DRAFT_1430319 [Mucidula mucida]
MVDWQSPEEVLQDGVFFGRFMHVLLGIYVWEWFTSLKFDWEHFSGRRPFRWPLIFYFLNRYCLLFALIGMEINCQALYTYNQVLGNAAIGLASINLSLRTIAVWSRSIYIVVPVIMVILGHWSLLLHGVLLKATWVPGQGCVITETDNKLLAITFIYGMAFDFTVLMLTAWKLVFSAPSAVRIGRSMLVTLIFGDGLIYFVVAFLSNLLATIFMLLNLNAVMSIIANVPAAVASTIVACRAVRRLCKYTQQGPDFLGTTMASSLAFRTTGATTTATIPKRPKVATSGLSGMDGVHVQMETFESPGTYVEYDAMGNIIKGSPDSMFDHDPEAQQIKDEFKRPPY